MTKITNSKQKCDTQYINEGSRDFSDRIAKSILNKFIKKNLEGSIERSNKYGQKKSIDDRRGWTDCQPGVACISRTV
jgi:hypothetical protein